MIFESFLDGFPEEGPDDLWVSLRGKHRGDGNFVEGNFPNTVTNLLFGAEHSHPLVLHRLDELFEFNCIHCHRVETSEHLDVVGVGEELVGDLSGEGVNQVSLAIPTGTEFDLFATNMRDGYEVFGLGVGVVCHYATCLMMPSIL